MPALPSLDDIRKKTYAKLGRDPCEWQAKVAREILKGQKDVICVAPTGSGKTLTFWMPLLFREDGIQIVVTPLNILGSQNEEELALLNIKAVAVRAETATPKLFKEIEDGKYRAIVVNPEELMKEGGGFEKLWKNASFTSHIISIVWDEAHCVSIWSAFRTDYKEAHRLRYLLPHVRFVLATATFPDPIREEVMRILHIRPNNCSTFHRSNDRPNVHIEVRKIMHPLSSFRDLNFLVPASRNTGDKLKKFLVFFDNIEESIKAAETLRKRLPPEEQDKVVWFNARMTPEFREDMTEAYKDDELYGLYSTDSFGMGVNVADIELVVQWRMSCDMNTLWQRFGRAARHPARTAVAILLVEPRFFDDEKQKAKNRAEARACKAQESGKRKAGDTGDQRAPKKARVQLETRADDSQVAQETSLSVESPLRAEQAREENVGNDSALTASKLAQLRETFQSATKKQGEGRAKKLAEENTLSPELDALVNAATRPFRCYQMPILAYYVNDQIESDHSHCRPELPAGCARCAPRVSNVCCSLCTPAAFSHEVALDSSDAAPAQAPRASTIKNKDPPSDAARELRHGLDDYRVQTTRDEFGSAILNDLGPSVVLPDRVLDRLVECARAKKIASLDDIRRETKWGGVHQYGPAVLGVILQHFPPAPLPLVSTPLRSRPEVTNVAASAAEQSSSRATRTVKQYACSACKQAGHNKRSPTCPARRSAVAQENVPVLEANPFNSSEPVHRDTDEQPSIVDTLFDSPAYRRDLHRAPPEMLHQQDTTRDAAERLGSSVNGYGTEPRVQRTLMSPVLPTQFYHSSSS